MVISYIKHIKHAFWGEMITQKKDMYIYIYTYIYMYIHIKNAEQEGFLQHTQC